MQFPERPTCHNKEPRYLDLAIEWRGDDTCSYCGSLSPQKLLDVLKDEQSRVSGSDWKYGWPHKFYVHDGKRIMHKWYNDHLRDEGYDEEAMKTLLFALTVHSGIEWFRDERGIGYSAPYHGYQRTGMDNYDMRRLGPQEPGTNRAQS